MRRDFGHLNRQRNPRSCGPVTRTPREGGPRHAGSSAANGHCAAGSMAVWCMLASMEERAREPLACQTAKEEKAFTHSSPASIPETPTMPSSDKGDTRIRHWHGRIARGRPLSKQIPLVIDAKCSFELERVTGIEPAPPAWKAGALPLSYTRAFPDTSRMAIWNLLARRPGNWSGRGDLNPRPPGPKPGALPLRHSPID